MAHSLTLMTVPADPGLAVADEGGRAREALAITGERGRSTLRNLRSILSVLTDGDDSPREPTADLGRLGARDRAQLVVIAYQSGLVLP